MGLRGAALLTSAAGFIAFAWSLKEHERENVFDDGAGSISAIVLGTTAYACLWSLVLLTVRLLMTGWIHPGVYIAFDMIAFLANTIGASMSLAVLAPVMSGEYNCRRRGCRGDLLMRVEVFGFVVVYINVVVYLILTAWACWACHCERRKAVK
ncbi:uncharacterized protein ACLA_077580 [Aspergillus clavatus NRRL 1]|uniref:MARVEL domain-containing protein n=1 Tax=Aspergillus clavatus (strain ATCC 1007 / CBS 513.65 / DSM 816 / NCTC 3887 / NRRL 1 / QM 1276 / 107) TaxID=344612 RepID=A1CLN2_ASPCL|nr:uncharacterized protein ACLA_077580 [Aspergillus clavatus NRRL 1]EAW09011.1 conserved hypothetical protein [Aspergillus clavatus NRRL 1]